MQRCCLRVWADSPEDFAAWVRRQQQPAVQDPRVETGRRVFESNACINCHTVGGHKTDVGWADPLSIVRTCSSIHSLARRVKGQNVYSIPTLLTGTSGETVFSCGECKVFSFAVLPPHLPRGDHRGDRNPDPSVGEHRRNGRAALDAV
jgi:hypothetical protein